MEISDVGLRMYVGHVYPHEHNLSKGVWVNLLIAAHDRGVSVRSIVLWYLWAQESGYYRAGLLDKLQDTSTVMLNKLKSAIKARTTDIDSSGILVVNQLDAQNLVL